MPRIILTENMKKALGGNQEISEEFTFTKHPDADHPTHSTYLAFRHSVHQNGKHIGDVDYQGFFATNRKDRVTGDKKHPAYQAFLTRK